VKKVNEVWVPFDVSFRESTTILFEQNLKRVKQETIECSFPKREKDNRILMDVGSKL
jgi:hypothetical protein